MVRNKASNDEKSPCREQFDEEVTSLVNDDANHSKSFMPILLTTLRNRVIGFVRNRRSLMAGVPTAILFGLLLIGKFFSSNYLPHHGIDFNRPLDFVTDRGKEIMIVDRTLLYGGLLRPLLPRTVNQAIQPGIPLPVPCRGHTKQRVEAFVKSNRILLIVAKSIQSPGEKHSVATIYPCFTVIERYRTIFTNSRKSVPIGGHSKSFYS